MKVVEDAVEGPGNGAFAQPRRIHPWRIKVVGFKIIDIHSGSGDDKQADHQGIDKGGQ